MAKKTSIIQHVQVTSRRAQEAEGIFELYSVRTGTPNEFEILAEYLDPTKAESHVRAAVVLDREDEVTSVHTKRMSFGCSIGAQRVYIDGETIGYQFNKGSFGSRVMSRKIRKIRIRDGELEGVTKIKDRRVAVRYLPEARFDWIALFEYQSEDELERDYGIIEGEEGLERKFESGGDEALLIRAKSKIESDYVRVGGLIDWLIERSIVRDPKYRDPLGSSAREAIEGSIDLLREAYEKMRAAAGSIEIGIEKLEEEDPIEEFDQETVLDYFSRLHSEEEARAKSGNKLAGELKKRSSGNPKIDILTDENISEPINPPSL